MEDSHVQWPSVVCDVPEPYILAFEISLKHNFLIRVLRDADETKEWIEEKNQALNTDNYGHDLASVQALQRKHEGFERDLAALGDKVFSSLLHSSFAFFVILMLCLFLHPCPGQLSGGDG